MSKELKKEVKKTFKKLTMKSLTEDVVSIEGGKKSLSIAQAKEVMGIVAYMLVGSRGEEVLKVLKATGARRAKKIASPTVAKKASKKSKKVKKLVS